MLTKIFIFKLIEVKRKKPDTDDEAGKPREVATTSSASPKKISRTKSSDPEQILKGVIFALSGFQNPLRSEIRDQGIKMGAKYRWGNTRLLLLLLLLSNQNLNIYFSIY